MALGMYWNLVEWNWNVLEWLLESGGINLECVGMALRIQRNGPQNPAAWPSESSGMTLGIQGNELGIWWKGIPLGFWWNPQFLPFQWIPNGILTFQSESVRVCQKPWGRVKYCLVYPHQIYISVCHRPHFLLATSTFVEGVFSKGQLALLHICNWLSLTSTHASMCLGAWGKLGLMCDADIRAAAILPGVVGEEDKLKFGSDYMTYD